MMELRLQQVPPQPVPGDLPTPPPAPGPERAPDPMTDPTDPSQDPPPVQDPDVIDPVPGPLNPPLIARSHWNPGANGRVQAKQ